MTRLVPMPAVVASVVGVVVAMATLIGAANSAQQAASYRACIADGLRADWCDSVAYNR